MRRFSYIHICIYAYAYHIYIYILIFPYITKKPTHLLARANLSTEFFLFVQMSNFLFVQMCAPVHCLSSTSRFPALPMRAQICIFLSKFALFSTYALSPTAYSPNEWITTHCTTLQHTATHCNTLQHTEQTATTSSSPNACSSPHTHPSPLPLFQT